MWESECVRRRARGQGCTRLTRDGVSGKRFASVCQRACARVCVCEKVCVCVREAHVRGAPVYFSKPAIFRANVERSVSLLVGGETVTEV